MPGYLVELSAAMTCLHQGKCSAVSAATRVQLGGSPALLKTSDLIVAGCTLPPPPGANGPDVSASWLTAAIRVKSNGIPLLLSDSQALCKTSGTGVIIQRTQVRVKAT